VNRLRIQALRFVLVGGLNTLVTFVALAILATLIDPRLAYTIVFACGLAFTSVFTGRYVFSARLSLFRLTAFVLWYLAIYAVGLSVISVITTHTDLSRLWLSALTVLVTAPLSFVGGRMIFDSRPSRLKGGL
jgi:putative flippase GtrA